MVKITYEDMPSTLPAGFLKSPGKGYGFTRELTPILYSLQDKFPSLREIVVSGSRDSSLANKRTIVLSAADLAKARPRIGAQVSRHREESKTLSQNILASIFPAEFDETVAKYTRGRLANFVTGYGLKPGLLSDQDIKAISDLMALVPSDHPFVLKGSYLDAKRSFDRILIEELLAKYRRLLKYKGNTKRLEDRWQAFFRENILYFNFGYVERFEKERIQGDKALNIPDFILLDTYRYLDVFEIKTHLTRLLALDRGRTNFYWTAEAAKALSQAENYIDSIIKEEDRLIKNIRDEYAITVDAVRPVVHIIASSRAHIAGPSTGKYRGGRVKKLWNDFRRLNNSLRSIRFVLYDELLDILENTLSRLQQDDTSEGVDG